MKKKISLVLSLVMVLSTLFSVNVFAKVKLPPISQSSPLITYTYNSSGKVYAYTSAKLNKKTGGYIACSTDECKIIQISGNAVKVTYPVGDNKDRTAWFSREAFTYRDLAKDAADSTFTAKISATTYKWKGKSSTFGSVAKGDKCYLLRGNEKSDWVQIIYPVFKGNKMGWVKGSDYVAMTSGKPSSNNNSSNSSTKSSELLSPLKNGLKNTSVSSTTNGIKCDFSASKGTPIYAPADGTVKFKQAYTWRTIKNGKKSTKEKYLTSYGNFIEFTSSDKKYNIKMCHLNGFNGVGLTIPSSKTWRKSGSSDSIVLKTKTVKQGDLLGYSGTTGNSSGPHLHMEVKKNGTPINPISVMKSWK